MDTANITSPQMRSRLYLAATGRAGLHNRLRSTTDMGPSETGWDRIRLIARVVFFMSGVGRNVSHFPAVDFEGV